MNFIRADILVKSYRLLIASTPLRGFIRQTDYPAAFDGLLSRFSVAAYPIRLTSWSYEPLQAQDRLRLAAPLVVPDCQIRLLILIVPSGLSCSIPPRRLGFAWQFIRPTGVP